MNVNYSINFLIASLMQGIILYITEYVKLTKLGIGLSIKNLIIFLVIGQVFAYILLFIYNKNKPMHKTNPILIGITFGVICWGVIVGLNFLLKVFNNPLTQGIWTIIIPILSFLIYGIFVSQAIKNKPYINDEA